MWLILVQFTGSLRIPYTARAGMNVHVCLCACACTMQDSDRDPETDCVAVVERGELAQLTAAPNSVRNGRWIRFAAKLTRNPRPQIVPFGSRDTRKGAMGTSPASSGGGVLGLYPESFVTALGIAIALHGACAYESPTLAFDGRPDAVVQTTATRKPINTQSESGGHQCTEDLAANGAQRPTAQSSPCPTKTAAEAVLEPGVELLPPWAPRCSNTASNESNESELDMEASTTTRTSCCSRTENNNVLDEGVERSDNEEHFGDACEASCAVTSALIDKLVVNHLQHSKLVAKLKQTPFETQYQAYEYCQDIVSSEQALLQNMTCEHALHTPVLLDEMSTPTSNIDFTCADDLQTDKNWSVQSKDESELTQESTDKEMEVLVIPSVCSPTAEVQRLTEERNCIVPSDYLCEQRAADALLESCTNVPNERNAGKFQVSSSCVGGHAGPPPGRPSAAHLQQKRGLRESPTKASVTSLSPATALSEGSKPAGTTRRQKGSSSTAHTAGRRTREKLWVRALERLLEAASSASAQTTTLEAQFGVELVQTRAPRTPLRVINRRLVPALAKARGDCRTHERSGSGRPLQPHSQDHVGALSPQNRQSSKSASALDVGDYAEAQSAKPTKPVCLHRSFHHRPSGLMTVPNGARGPPASSVSRTGGLNTLGKSLHADLYDTLEPLACDWAQPKRSTGDANAVTSSGRARRCPFSLVVAIIALMLVLASCALFLRSQDNCSKELWLLHTWKAPPPI